MYTAEVPTDKEEYEEIHVDKRIFYRLKEKKEDTKKSTRKRRYSDQFKDPLFIQKENNRKLRMIRYFRQNNGNLEELIEKWKDCISTCIMILCEHGISPIDIFKALNLKKYNFNIEDYGTYNEDST